MPLQGRIDRRYVEISYGAPYPDRRSRPSWRSTDILYDKHDGIATITINRPNVAQCVSLPRRWEEMLAALYARAEEGPGYRRHRARRGGGSRLLRRRRQCRARFSGKRRLWRARACSGCRSRNCTAQIRDKPQAGHRPRAGLLRSAAATCWRPCATDDCRRRRRCSARSAPGSVRSIWASVRPICRGSWAKSGRGKSGICPPVHGRQRHRDGPRQQHGARRPARRRGRDVVPRDQGNSPTASRSPSVRSTRIASHSASHRRARLRGAGAVYDSEELKEGRRAFREKRRPDFRGKRRR